MLLEFLIFQSFSAIFYKFGIAGNFFLRLLNLTLHEHSSSNFSELSELNFRTQSWNQRSSAIISIILDVAEQTFF